jgi:hypothetical protein
MGYANPTEQCDHPLGFRFEIFPVEAFLRLHGFLLTILKEHNSTTLTHSQHPLKEGQKKGAWRYFSLPLEKKCLAPFFESGSGNRYNQYFQ